MQMIHSLTLVSSFVALLGSVVRVLFCNRDYANGTSGSDNYCTARYGYLTISHYDRRRDFRLLDVHYVYPLAHSYEH
jgi:hypothetical protein